MELVGEEKRIHTLFSEARLADEQTAPSFAATWSRAQRRSFRRRQAFNLSLVSTTLLVCALVSLAWWSKYWQRSRPNAVVPVDSTANVIAVPASTIQKPDKKAAPESMRERSYSKHKSRALDLTARRQNSLVAAQRKATRDATAISNWQSPTGMLLNSPAAALLKSLPQLNENANRLKAFLPNTSN
jgi:hypothetical protein